jgi:hypothetical protein
MTKKDFKDSIATQTTQLSPAMAFVSATPAQVVAPQTLTHAEGGCTLDIPNPENARTASTGTLMETKSKKTQFTCRPSDMEPALKIATMRRVSLNELLNIYLKEGKKKDFKLVARYDEVFGNEDIE